MTGVRARFRPWQGLLVAALLLSVPPALDAAQQDKPAVQSKAKAKPVAKSQAVSKPKSASKPKVTNKPKSASKPKASTKPKAKRKPKVASIPFPAGLPHNRKMATALERPLTGLQRVVSIRHGCLETGVDIPLTQLWVAPPQGAQLDSAHQSQLTSACQPYAYALNADGEVAAFSMVRANVALGIPDADLIETAVPTAGGTAGDVALPGPTYADALLVRVLDIEARAFDDPVETSVPVFTAAQVSQLQTLLPQLRETAQTPAAELVLRVAYKVDEAEAPVQLLVVSLIDKSSQQLLDRAVFLERDDLPGGWFSARDGRGLQREFWITPVSYHRISRGVITTPQRKGKSRGRVHMGVDYAAARGTPVHAVAAAKVLFSGRHGTYGNLIILEHAGGYTSYYGHLDRIAADITVGAAVERDQELGAVGSTGRATGPHLHFEIRLDGSYLKILEESRNAPLWSLRATDWVDFMARVVFAQWVTGPVTAS